MGQSNHYKGLVAVPILALYFLLSLLACQSTHAYHNYRVGDTLGWYDNLQEPKVNYDKWVAGKNFSLGDFLFFNTDKNHSVLQSYNLTTYKLCDAYGDDVTEWSAGEPDFSKETVIVAVPLLKVGMTYFFSGNYDGEQCNHGQHLKINVTYGQGLPESLKTPTESPAPTSPEEGGSVPDTVVPSNFDHPNNSGDLEATSESSHSLFADMNVRSWRFHLLLGIVGILFVLA